MVEEVLLGGLPLISHSENDRFALARWRSLAAPSAAGTAALLASVPVLFTSFRQEDALMRFVDVSRLARNFYGGLARHPGGGLARHPGGGLARHPGGGLARHAAGLLVACTAGSLAFAVDTVDARARLKELGLTVSGPKVALAAEADLVRDIGKSAEPQRKLRQANSTVQQHEAQLRGLADQITRLQAQLVELNARIANNPNDNRTIGAINAIQGQRQLLDEQKDRATEQGRKLRAELNELRETYAQRMLDLRGRAEALEKAYADKAGDKAVREAVAAAAAADGREYAFGPSQSLQSALKKLKTLEDAIFSDTIQLEREGGVLVASTVINGEHVQPMMVDSGCSSLLVPHRLAERFNVVPADYDRTVTCTLADGSTVKGYLKKLQSVRVGRFVVEDVECVVLGPDAVAAEPLLGMSFLGKFEFKLNPDAATLEMLKVGAPD